MRRKQFCFSFLPAQSASFPSFPSYPRWIVHLLLAASINGQSWRWNIIHFFDKKQTDYRFIKCINIYCWLYMGWKKLRKIRKSWISCFCAAIFLLQKILTEKQQPVFCRISFSEESAYQTQTNRSTVQKIMTHQTAAQKTSELFHELDYILIYSLFSSQSASSTKKDKIFSRYDSFLRAFVNISLSFCFISSHDISMSTAYKYKHQFLMI